MAQELESRVKSKNVTKVTNSNSSSSYVSIQEHREESVNKTSSTSVKSASYQSEMKNLVQNHAQSTYSKKNSCFTPVKILEKENKINQENDDLKHKPRLKSEKKRKFNTGHSKSNTFSSPSPSVRRPSNVGVIMSSLKKKGGKLIRTLTPPRHLQVGIQTPLAQQHQQQKRRQKDHDAACSKITESLSLSPSTHTSSMMTATMTMSQQKLTLSPKFQNANQYSIRSSEIDPSPFQLDIPSHESVLTHCKICCLMENYFDIGGFDFDFSSLMPWGGNKRNTSPELDLLSGYANDPSFFNKDASRIKRNDDNDKINQVLAHLHEIVDDIVVEGFFREYYDDENRESGLGRVEVCVLSSNKLRRFIVCYRCSSDVQDRPLYGPQFKKKVPKPKDTSSSRIISQQGEESKDDEKDSNNNDSNHQQNQQRLAQADVNEVFLKAFNITKLQENIITLLNRLTSLKPFNDVVCTGHSFSGALATLASQSFASNRPATRVYCHVFGSPIVGGGLFRNEVHSLPNLNLIRIERSTDPFVHLPENNTTNHNHHHHNSQNNNTSDSEKKNTSLTDWVHAGHCLRLMPTSSFTVTDESKRPVDVRLYRFDKFRPSSNFMKASLLSVNNLKKLKIGNEIKSYRKDLEKIKSLKLSWVDAYYGEVKAGDQSGTGGVFA